MRVERLGVRPTVASGRLLQVGRHRRRRSRAIGSRAGRRRGTPGRRHGGRGLGAGLAGFRSPLRSQAGDGRGGPLAAAPEVVEAHGRLHQEHPVDVLEGEAAPHQRVDDAGGDGDERQRGHPSDQERGEVEGAHLRVDLEDELHAPPLLGAACRQDDGGVRHGPGHGARSVETLLDGPAEVHGAEKGDEDHEAVVPHRDLVVGGVRLVQGRHPGGMQQRAHLEGVEAPLSPHGLRVLMALLVDERRLNVLDALDVQGAVWHTPVEAQRLQAEGDLDVVGLRVLHEGEGLLAGGPGSREARAHEEVLAAGGWGSHPRLVARPAIEICQRRFFGRAAAVSEARRRRQGRRLLQRGLYNGDGRFSLQVRPVEVQAPDDEVQEGAEESDKPKQADRRVADPHALRGLVGEEVVPSP
mmetsp:Transcript_45867/g.133509  ORF Transcript_45867/g.133509 Transcript_45867/m.133509 type:complete len:412 (+) Transcript_45867:244-1479(+)